MKSLLTIVQFIYDNWSALCILLAVIAGCVVKIKKILSTSKEERLNALLTEIKNTLLPKMEAAEKEWIEYVKSGKFKKSDVIAKIYAQYPELSKFVDQDAIIEKISELIEEGMPALNALFDANNTTTTTDDTTTEASSTTK